MSQAKVDRYKEQKANRKEIMQKEKRQKTIYKCTAAVLGLCIIGWLGFSVYTSYENALPKEVVEVNYSAVEDYLYSIY